MSSVDDHHHTLAGARSAWERAAAEFLRDPADAAKAEAERSARHHYDHLLRDAHRGHINW